MHGWSTTLPFPRKDSFRIWRIFWAYPEKPFTANWQSGAKARIGTTEFPARFKFCLIHWPILR